MAADDSDLLAQPRYRTPAIAIDLDPLARGVFNFKEGDAESAWAPFSAGEAVIVSEPLAYRTGVTAGDRIEPLPQHLVAEAASSAGHQ